MNCIQSSCRTSTAHALKLYLKLVTLDQKTMSSHVCVEFQSYIRGHHVYCSSWTPVIGEELVLKRQPDNEHSKHAVAVVKDGDVVGHVPEFRSKLIFYFLGYDGNVGFCKVTGARLNQGVGLGVEVPCVYKFWGRNSHLQKLQELIQEV